MKISRCAVIPVLAAVLAGCMSRDNLVERVRDDRTRAFSQWQAQAQSQESREVLTGNLSLGEALALGLENNKSLRATKQAKEAARGQLVASYSNALPKVDVDAGYTRLDKSPFFVVGGVPVTLTNVNQYNATGSVKQPLFRGGAIPAAIRGASLFALSSDEEVRGAVQQAISKVARAYFEVLLAQHLQAVREDTVTSAQATLDDVQRKRNHGASSDFDVLRAETELSLSRAELIQQKNRVRLARTALYLTMGVSQQSDVQLSDKLLFRRMKPDFVQAMQIAYENRPDLARADLSLKMQREALTVARSKYYPELNAFFNYGLSKPDPHNSMDNTWGNQWSTGVVASLSIFDGLAREGKIIETKANLKRSQLELVAAEEQAAFEVQSAILNLSDAEEFVDSQQLNLRRAQEGLRLAQVGYREGVNTEVEVIDARSAATKARSLYYQAVFNHVISKLDLQLAIGTMGPPLGSTSESLDQAVPGEMAAFPSGPPEEPPATAPVIAPATAPKATTETAKPAVEAPKAVESPKPASDATQVPTKP